MKTNQYLIALFILLSAATSYGQTDEDFSLASIGTDGTEYYVFIEKSNYSTKDIWVKYTENVRSIKNKKGKMVKIGGEKTMSFMTINCSEREYDLIQTTVYSRDGTFLKQREIRDYGNKIVPGSVMAGICDYVCAQE
ncbi:MAG: hypothetical protein EOO51_12365 [Flavobacterium sp.]|nr:MAG: hypothetical protein EOO51_12365 [Flavobacterium sp.]